MNSPVEVQCEQDERLVWVEVDRPLVERWQSAATTNPAIYGDPSLPDRQMKSANGRFHFNHFLFFVEALWLEDRIQCQKSIMNY